MHIIVLGFKEHSHRSAAEVLYIGQDRIAANEAPAKAIAAGKEFACFKRVVPEHYFPMPHPATYAATPGGSLDGRSATVATAPPEESRAPKKKK